MKSYVFESAEVSSVQSLSQIKVFISKEIEAIQISALPLFDGENRISLIFNQLSHWQVIKHIDQLYFEHIQYIYHLFDLEVSIALSECVHSCFEQIELKVNEARIQQNMQEEERLACISILKDLASKIVSKWLEIECKKKIVSMDYENCHM